MRNNSKEYSIFSDEKVIEKLKKGKNPLPAIIKPIVCLGKYMYKDKISREIYEYIPSEKNNKGKALGYSFERLTMADGTSYVSEIAEYSKDRSNDRYRINENEVTREEFYKKRENSFKQNAKVRNSFSENSVGLDEHFVVSSVINSGNMDAISTLISSLEKRVKGNNILNNAVNQYNKSEDMPEKWRGKSVENAIELYKLSEFIKEKSKVELEKANLINYFSNIKDDISLFTEKLYTLINYDYFTNLDKSEYEDVVLYLTDVFTCKGINDIIEFLLKMKSAYIEYSNNLFSKKSSEVITVAIGLTNFKYKCHKEDILLDLSNIKISIYNKLNDYKKKKTKWHEFSHVLLQPLDNIIEEKELEKLVDDYTFELLNAQRNNKKI